MTSAQTYVNNKPNEFLIIGAGVLALSTATILQTRYAKTPIKLIASGFPTPSPMSKTISSKPSVTASPQYASMWAGAHYRPIPYIPSTHSAFATLAQDKRDSHLQLAREQRWALATAERMKSLARSNSESGVQIVQAEEYLESPPLENLLLRSGDTYASSDDAFHVFEREELEALNEESRNGRDRKGDVRWACRYETYVVNVHLYCAYLLQQFIQCGGRTVQQQLTRTGDAIQHSSVPDGKPIIINCSGIGVELDPNKSLIRGQTALVRNEFPKTITRQCEDGTWSFLIPRPCGGGTIVGGTKQIGDEHGLPRAEERKQLLENAVKYFPEFVGRVQDFDIVCDNVGMRPWRKGGVRVEVEDITVEDGDGEREVSKVVHGYGAGGRGYEISWGVAEEVCGLVSAISNQGQGGRAGQKARL